VYGGEKRFATSPFVLGSIKTNIGHLEGAAGISGLLKVVMSLKHEMIPPHLHLKRMNKHISEIACVRAVIPRTAIAWPSRNGQVRHSVVSSFGITGTNAHAILREAPVRKAVGAATETTSTSKGPMSATRTLLCLSAKSEGALRELAKRFAGLLHSMDNDLKPSHNNIDIGKLCAAAALCRTQHMQHRAAFAIVSSGAEGERRELAQRLREVAEKDNAPAGANISAAAATTTAKLAASGGVAFLFTGQGAQYENAGRELYEEGAAADSASAVFRHAMDQCEALLKPLFGGQSVLEVIYPATKQQATGAGQIDVAATSSQSFEVPAIQQTRYAQAVLFMLEYSLAELWASFGVVPSFVLGHSVGELAAACVAGVFGLEDGLRLVEARGRLMGSLEKRATVGTMAAVATNEQTIQAALSTGSAVHPGEKVGVRVSVAAVNGPQQVVVSGERESVEELLARVERDAATTISGNGSGGKVKFQMLRVSNAFHSHLMEPILDEFERVAAGVQFSGEAAPSAVHLVSTVTGAFAEPNEIRGSEYWRKQLRGTVHFGKAVQCVHAAGCRAFVEAGPHPVLLGMAAASLESLSPPQTLMIPSIRRGVGAWETFLGSLGKLYTDAGVNIELGTLYGGAADDDLGAAAAHLPTYPFQRKRFWVTGGSVAVAPPGDVAAKQQQQHPLLGPLVDTGPLLQGDDGRSVFAMDLAANGPGAWLADHVVAGSPVLPFTGYLEMMVAAACRVFAVDARSVEVCDAEVRAPIVLPSESGAEPVKVYVVVTKKTTTEATCTISTKHQQQQSWQMHAQSQLVVTAAAVATAMTEDACHHR
jgi:polyketide synthase 12/polyene macrolide polyketide synthase/epothilone polyketide synthase D